MRRGRVALGAHSKEAGDRNFAIPSVFSRSPDGHDVQVPVCPGQPPSPCSPSPRLWRGHLNVCPGGRWGPFQDQEILVPTWNFCSRAGPPASTAPSMGPPCPLPARSLLTSQHWRRPLLPWHLTCHRLSWKGLSIQCWSLPVGLQ